MAHHRSYPWHASRAAAQLGAIGELDMLHRLLQQHHRQSKASGRGQGKDPMWIPPGDDGAAWLLPQKGQATSLIATTDMLVEDVDFRLRWARPQDVGCKLVAVNASDLAAMGAHPLGLLVSLALPQHFATQALVALQRAVLRACAHYNLRLLGGDISSTQGPMVLSGTALGLCHQQQVLRRYGGQPGDIIGVAGPLGLAAAGLDALEQDYDAPPKLLQAQLRPKAQLALGTLLACQPGVRSGCDISDGLLQDARYLCGPGVGMVLDWKKIPIHPLLPPLARAWRRDLWRWVLAGGEDFVLLVAVAKTHWHQVKIMAQKHGHGLTAIGRLVDRPIFHVQGLPAGTQIDRIGFHHFSPPHP